MPPLELHLPVFPGAFARACAEHRLATLSAQDPDLHPRHPAGAPDSQGGQFAPKYDASAEETKGRTSLFKVVATHDDISDAMLRPDTGPIDFRWGDEGEGVQHILRRAADRVARFQRGPTPEETVAALPGVIARGKLRHLNTRVAIIEHKDELGVEWRVLLAKDFHGKKSNHWLLSGYDRDEEKKGGR
jgi:hypothetical protein